MIAVGRASPRANTHGFRKQVMRPEGPRESELGEEALAAEIQGEGAPSPRDASGFAVTWTGRGRPGSLISDSPTMKVEILPAALRGVLICWRIPWVFARQARSTHGYLPASFQDADRGEGALLFAFHRTRSPATASHRPCRSSS